MNTNHKNDLISLIGSQSCLTDTADMQPFLHEWRGRMEGKAAAVMLPQTPEQVSTIIKFCNEHHIAVVPQGGNTGLVGASVPDNPNAIVLSLKRMNAIRSIDASDFSMVVEAGCILQKAKEAAAAQNRLLAMTLASEGSACIGGLIATNAGGSYTIKYGNMREQVLGLEAVLPDGTIWNGLRTLRKNNSGYDIKQLLIGSEGTLGVITAATLLLCPLPQQIETALIGLATPEAALQVYTYLREQTGDALAAFELIPRIAIETARKNNSQIQEPFSGACPWYALIETHECTNAPTARLENALETLLEKSLILDGAIAENLAQAKSFWYLREAIVESQKILGAALKHDPAVPISHIPALITKGSTLVEKLIPAARPYLFGHMGDGNIHFNISQPEKMSKETFLAKRETVASALHDLVISMGGSLSAEHGIGRFKRDEFHRTVNRTEFEAMRCIKRALDPNGIMNPDVIF